MSEYEALLDQGYQSLQDGDTAAALEAISKARALDAERPESLYLLGLVALNLGRTLDARDLMLEGHLLAPDWREFSSALSFIYAGLGQLAESLYHSKMVHAQIPQNPILSRYEPANLQDSNNALNHVNLPTFFENAAVCWAERNFPLAQEFCEDAIRFNPSDTRALDLMGKICLARRDYGRAAGVLRSLLATDVAGPTTMSALACALNGLGETAQAATLSLEAMVRGGHSPDVLGDVAQVCKALPDGLYERVRQALQACWETSLEKLSEEVEAAPVYAEPLSDDRPLKVGFLIGETAVRTQTEQLDALLACADQMGISAYVYTVFASNPEMARRLTARIPDRWTDITGMDDDTAAIVIAGEELDVLVDMMGIADDARPGVLIAHPATLVVSWLGGEISRHGVDRILTDEIIAPAFDAETNTLPMVMGSVLFQPRTALMQTTANGMVLPVAKNGYVTFGATLNLPQVQDSMPLWSRILSVVPGSKLILGNIGPIPEILAELALDIAGSYGVADRIQFEQVEAIPVPYAFWGQCDIYLAALSGEGFATVMESLALGVPTVVHSGKRLEQRLVMSALAAAGQGHWCGADQDYVSVAASMAKNPKAAFDLRRGFLERMPELPLFSAGFFAQAFMHTLRAAVAEKEAES